MAYTTNEKVAEVRAKAVNMVRGGKSTHEVARYFGYGQSTIVKWCKRVPKGVIFNVKSFRCAGLRGPTISRFKLGKLIVKYGRKFSITIDLSNRNTTIHFGQTGTPPVPKPLSEYARGHMTRGTPAGMCIEH